MTMRAPCVRCGNTLHTGEGRVVVAFSPTELEQMVYEISDASVRRRLICAIGLLDPDAERRITGEAEPR